MQGASPWARSAGGRRSPGEEGQDRAEPAGARSAASRRRPRPRRIPAQCALLRSEEPTVRCPAGMCAARTPPLGHIFRGTFVHSTWTCPMQVLRDHLLGVSDSGQVSGRRGSRTSTGGWKGRFRQRRGAVPR